MQKITPFLWFDGQAEEAANFYVSVFKNSKITSVGRYGDAGPGVKGTVMSVTFELEGQSFFALNGGPLYKFTPAISQFTNSEMQGEVDALWEKLFGIAGKAGNLRGKIQVGGNPFEAPRQDDHAPGPEPGRERTLDNQVSVAGGRPPEERSV